MRKPIVITTLIIGVILIGFIGRCVYMVLCISCTTPPIKTYEYKGSVAQFAISVEKLTLSNNDIEVKISRRDSSNKVDDGGRDMEIAIKKDTDNVIYGLVCEQDAHNTQIEMVSAIKNNIHGGYSATAPEVKELLNNFENDFLVRLKNQQHVVLKSE